MGEQIQKGRLRSLDVDSAHASQQPSHSSKAWIIHAFFIMMWTVLFLLATKAFAASLPSLGSKYDSAKDLMSEYFDWRVDSFPLAASEKGVHRNDLFLRDNSLQGFKDIKELTNTPTIKIHFFYTSRLFRLD